MVKLRNFLLRKVYNIFKDHCYEMFRLQSVQGKNRLPNVSDTKCSGYKMLGYKMIRLRDRCYELWLQNVRYEMSKLRHVWQLSCVLMINCQHVIIFVSRW